MSGNFGNVGIVGAGMMGSGIAQVCAQAGLKVMMMDSEPVAVEKARENIAWSVGKFIEKGKVKEDRETILSRISGTTDINDLKGVDIVIENVYEDLSLKREVFKTLASVVSKDVLLATDTSAIPITELAAVTPYPERVLGLHFFSPAQMMKAVEVIRGVTTSDEVMEKGVTFVEMIGKRPIRVERDIAGFLLNRINFPSTIEAIRLVEEGIATVQEIDEGMRLAFGRRMGPFETGDMVGLDVMMKAMMSTYEETKDMKFYPPVLMQRKVTAGHLGIKTRKGWYDYNEDGTRKG
ncbi:MAG: 3-hydroxybutyryl-CoA dehydrogenase [Deltaproteobacteria bacterium]|nr:MAG: 3-hydroxybutyryl-CoA dehydrogenase [Deltaproteobacteria bacterium]